VAPLSRATLWALGLTGGAAFVVLASLFHTMRMDDAFITYRYAQNLVEGRGLAFNPGERLQGSTAPGHLLLSALAYWLLGAARMPTAMAVLGCAAWVAQGLAAFLLVRRLLPERAAWLAAAFIWAGAPDAAPWVPLETPLVAALALWSLWAAAASRWTLAMGLVGAAALVRPDAALLALLLGGWGLWERRRAFLGPALLGLAVVGPWVAFATWYFGTPLPHTAVAKFQTVPFLEYLSAILEHTSRRLLLDGSLPAALLAWLLAAAGAALLVVRSRRAVPLVAYGLLHFGAYLYLRPYTSHHWHQYPGVVVLVVCGAAAVGWACVAPPQRWVRAAGAALALGLLGAYGWRTARMAQGHTESFWMGARDRVYRDVAAHLVARAAGPGDLLGAVEVGTVAYHSGVRVLDMGGLVTALERQDGWDRDVRWVMVDQGFAHLARGLLPLEPLTFQHGDFAAFLFEAPPGRAFVLDPVEHTFVVRPARTARR
jgi:hypothetical protein